FWFLIWATKPTPQASCSLAGSYRPWCCGRDILFFLNKNNQPRKRPNAAYMANARPTCGQTRGEGEKKYTPIRRRAHETERQKTHFFQNHSSPAQDRTRSVQDHTSLHHSGACRFRSRQPQRGDDVPSLHNGLSCPQYSRPRRVPCLH